jgi:hypothetical protein
VRNLRVAAQRGAGTASKARANQRPRVRGYHFWRHVRGIYFNFIRSSAASRRQG